MIQALKALFERPDRESEESDQRNLRLAAAALLVETVRADFIEDAAELTKLAQLLTTSLNLEQDEVYELVVAAQARVERSHLTLRVHPGN